MRETPLMFFEKRRSGKEIQAVLGFLTSYFGGEVREIVLYGSFLTWRFRRSSDIDIAVILRDSKRWRASASADEWQKTENSPRRADFYHALARFLQRANISRQYDIKLYTTLDLELLEKFQTWVVPARGSLVHAIKAGRTLFRRKEEGTMVNVKKGHKSFLEFLDTELKKLGMTHWYSSSDNYGIGCDYHEIGKEQVIEYSLFGFTWCKRKRITLGDIIAEPDSPIDKGDCDAFRIRVKDHEAIPVVKQLLEKFEQADFGMKAEVVY